MSTPYEVILQQLGGNKFLAMTGASNLVTRGQADLAMKLPRGFAKDGINHVRIVLDRTTDTYTVTFSKTRGLQSATVRELATVYGDQLPSVFESITGLRVSL